MTQQENRIHEVAYLLWAYSGRPDGHDLEFWCAAENWVNREVAAGGGAENPKRMKNLTMPWPVRPYAFAERRHAAPA